jgi:Ca2+-binding RTX toxin-like protein
LVGGASGDVLTASGPNGAELVAGNGTETLNGGGATGDLVLFGGVGADNIVGGSGNDLIIAGSGNATISGGTGSNNYLFAALPGTTRAITITDFDPNHNALNLFGYGDPKAAGAAALASETIGSGSTTLHLTDGTSIILSGAPTLNTTYNFYGA